MPNSCKFKLADPFNSNRTAIVFLIFIIFPGYLITLSPDIQWLDSSELQTVAILLGVGHPPGEPLYALVSHLARFIPIGSLPFRVNLISALTGVLASIIFYGILIRLTSYISREPHWQDRLAAFLLTLFLAFLHAFWIQTTRSEVYSLNILLAAIILYLSLHALHITQNLKHEKNEAIQNNAAYTKTIYLISFVLGVASGNHSLLIALMAPPVLFFLILPRLSTLRLKGILVCLLFFIFGLSIYLYLPLRAVTMPPVNWGNPNSLERVIWMVTGSMFQKSFHLTTDQLLSNIEETIFILMYQINFIFFFFSILGLWAILRRRMILGSFLIAIMMFNLISVVTQQVFIGTNPDLFGYLLPSFLILVIGIYSSFRELTLLLKNKPWIKNAFTAVFLILVITLPIYSIPDALKDTDRRSQYSANTFGKAILDTAKPHSYIVTSNIATLFTTWHIQYVENYRRDVTVIHAPFLPFKWHMENLRHHRPRLNSLNLPTTPSINDILFHLKDRPLFFELGLGINDLLLPFLRPDGLLFQYNPDANPLSYDMFERQRFTLQSLHDKMAVDSNGVEAVKALYWQHYCHGIYYAYNRYYDQAQWEFEQCLKLNPNAQEIKNLIIKLKLEKETGQITKWSLQKQR